MTPPERIADWLETHWVTPAYSGWLLGGLGLFFFAAATNTMAGWLYVISGVTVALLAIAAILPERSLRGIQVTRSSINPISAGESLTIELTLENQTSQTKTLLQTQDLLPHVLGNPVKGAIESVPARGSYRWVYHQPTQRRGVYRWQTVQLRTAAPLGLFWCRRSQNVKATAVVYPIVLPLTQCPLIDEMGRNENAQIQSNRRSQSATEGLTRALRPYRWGDPTRLVHWRTSARYGELRIRELEVVTGGQELIICLDSAETWNLEDFEQAVIAAAALYFYAVHQGLTVKLWTAGTGLVRGNYPVLEALAATFSGEETFAGAPPNLPLVWLSQSLLSLNALPLGSRWVLWQKPKLKPSPDHISPSQPTTLDGVTRQVLLNRDCPGLVVQADQPLQLQLQKQLNWM